MVIGTQYWSVIDNMATYDHGGGCPCGLYKKCDEGCREYTPPRGTAVKDARDRGEKLGKEMLQRVRESNYYNNIERKKMKLNETDDFGFTFADSKESQSKVISFEDRAVSAEAKIDGLRAMIMPLLNNLMRNPEKDTILWPDRETKIKAFIKKMDDYINT
jgi:hypothetical protein